MGKTITVFDMVVQKIDGSEISFRITNDYPVLQYKYGGPEGINSLVIYKGINDYTSIPCPDIKRLITREKEIEIYEIRYVIDNEIIEIDSIEVGLPIIPPEITEKEGYTFCGWNEIPEVMPANDLVISGSFKTNSYKLVYIVDDTEYKTISVEYGSVVVAEPYPTKEGYTFSGWSVIPETMPACDVEIRGCFSINQYSILFVNEDGTVLQYTVFEYGSNPYYSGETPSKEATVQYTYTFIGWSPLIEPVTGDVVYTAQYESIVNKYVVSFVGEDGTVLESTAWEYGSTPYYGGETPSKEATVQYTYTFIGWSPFIEPVTCDVVYTAQYESTVNKYVITFVDEDGTVLESTEWEYGSTPEYEGSTPSKEADLDYIYTFSGWSPEIVPVVSAVIYVATYNATPTGVRAIGSDMSSGLKKVYENGKIFINMPDGTRITPIGVKVE